MTRSMHGDLLPSHVRALEAATGGSPLAHEKFEWRMINGSWAGHAADSQLPAIFHVETGFLFSIEYHEAWMDEYGAGGPAEFRYFRSPGVQGPTETLIARAWDEVLFDFRLWLRLIAREIGHHDAPRPFAPQDRRAMHVAEVWSLVHPDIREAARAQFDAGRYADAVDSALARVNFGEMPSGPLLGVLNGRRVSTAIDQARAIHFLFLASLLRYQIEETPAAQRVTGTG